MAITGDPCLRQLAHHLPAKPDPATPAKLQPKPGSLLDSRPERGRRPGRQEDDQESTCPPGERGQAGQLISRAGHRGSGPGRWPPYRDRRQVQDDHVHRPGLEERTGHRERLAGPVRDEDGQPFESHPASHGLNRIQAP